MINKASSNTKYCFTWKGKRLHDDNDGADGDDDDCWDVTASVCVPAPSWSRWRQQVIPKQRHMASNRRDSL
jgi:hypothetical protein